MGQVQVIEAVYGASSGSLDVTAAVQALLDGGMTSITPSNEQFGSDPSPGVVKNFSVLYQVGQMRRTAACAEQETVKLAQPPPIVVLGAVFGATAGSADVTAAVQGIIATGVTAITASVANFGDPAPNSPKHFGVTWLDASGSRHTAGCAEHETVTLS